MKVNIRQHNRPGTPEEEYLYDNYRPKKSDYYRPLYRKSKNNYKWVIQLLVSGAIFLIIAGLFRVNVPFITPVKKAVKYLMNTETNVQPVFYKIMQLASPEGDMDWPVIDNTPQQAKTTTSAVPSGPVSVLPVSGKVSRLYGWTVEPGEKVQVFHEGIDINVPVGTDVKASTGGKVIAIGQNGKVGKYILVQGYTGQLERYANLSETMVQLEQTIKIGDIIAKTGTADDNQPHLHFEVIVGYKPIDPLNTLGIDFSGISNVNKSSE